VYGRPLPTVRGIEILESIACQPAKKNGSVHFSGRGPPQLPPPTAVELSLQSRAYVESRRDSRFFLHHDDTSNKNQDPNAATFYNGFEAFLKYFVQQGTSRNVSALHQGLVSYEVLPELHTPSFWTIRRKWMSGA
jgi:hypothetical protein